MSNLEISLSFLRLRSSKRFPGLSPKRLSVTSSPYLTGSTISSKLLCPKTFEAFSSADAKISSKWDGEAPSVGVEISTTSTSSATFKSVPLVPVTSSSPLSNFEVSAPVFASKVSSV